MRVLCVDDNATHRTILEQQLRAWGMQVDSAASGSSALARLQAAHDHGTPYTLALVDLQMPDMDGVELARLIKAEPELAMVRLIMLGVLGQRNHEHTAQCAGIAAYVTKPVRQSHLYDSIVTVLAASSAPQPATLLPPPTVAKAPAATRLRVLLAEDNIVNQRVAVRLLERLGCRVDAVANGREAVAALARIAYALVFMDCQMPEMDGYDATAAIRAREHLTGSHIPIIAMTANAMPGDRERCLQAGMDDYVSKPVNAERLLEVLQKWTVPATTPQAQTHPLSPTLADATTLVSPVV
jgi:CheY-like chemotaxis protein